MKKRYKILPYTYKQAKKLGVTLKPSTRKGKKIDVFKGDKKVASVGAIGYQDYPNFKRLEALGLVTKGTASRRRKAYKKRHEKDRHRKGTPGYYADKLLW